MNAQARAHAVAVVGMGNVLMRDDGAGVRAVRELERAIARHDVIFVDGGTDPWSALDAARGCRALVVLDALLGGGQAGDVYVMALDEMKTRTPTRSLHDVTVFDLVRLDAALGRGFSNVMVIGMEPGRIEAGIGLSPQCEERLPVLVDAAAREIHRLTAEPMGESSCLSAN